MKKMYLIALLMGVSTMFIACNKEQGCTDSTATNYNTNAEEDDGSCTYSTDSTNTGGNSGGQVTDSTSTGGNNGGTTDSTSTGGSTTPTGNYVVADVNGVGFVSKDDDLFEYYKIQFGNHQLTGKKDDTESINLWFWSADSIKVGTYDLTDESIQKVTATYLTVNPYDTYSCEAKNKDKGAVGTVTITSNDGTTVTGTFEYTAVNNAGDKIIVTNGKFSLSTMN